MASIAAPTLNKDCGAQCLRHAWFSAYSNRTSGVGKEASWGCSPTRGTNLPHWIAPEVTSCRLPMRISDVFICASESGPFCSKTGASYGRFETHLRAKRGRWSGTSTYRILSAEQAYETF
jgi:hypothetical protein